MMGDFGLSVHINLFGCNHEKICDIEYIKAWMIDLCNYIEMKRHGDMIAERFGTEPHLYGYSVMQLIETSCITAHFSEQTDCCYIDVFSCKDFDDMKTTEFCADYFDAKDYTYETMFR